MLGVALVHQLRHMGFSVQGMARPAIDALRADTSQLPLQAGIVVINAVGLINRRLGDTPESHFWRVNGLWPRVVADACDAAGAHLIHVSTDCVFDGAGAPHTELCRPDAADVYGASKAAGEPANALVIRSSIIGPELDHHYSLLSWFMGQPPKATVRGFTNHLWNGVTTLELSRAIGEIVLSGGHELRRVQHVFGQDVSKFELLEMMKLVFDKGSRVDPVEEPPGRDMRLATAYPAFLAALRIRSMLEQLRDLRPLCDARGAWLGESA
jgi:dTDP-4-dehydrorhamnose reductase